jgi:ABC-type multidrug transport system fused ATPase/permease subunit
MDTSKIFAVYRGLSHQVRRGWQAVVTLGAFNALLELLVSLTFGILVASAIAIPSRTNDLNFGNYSISTNTLLYLFVFLIFTRIALTLAESLLKAKVTSSSILEFSGKFLNLLLLHPGESKKSSSQLQVDVIDSTNYAFRWSFLGLANAFSLFLMILMLTTLAVLMEPLYGSVLIFIFCLILVPIVYAINKDLVRLNDDLQEASNKIYNLVKQTIELKKEISLYKKVEKFRLYFHSLRKSKADLESRVILKSAFPKLAVESAFFLSVALFVLISLSNTNGFEVDQNLLTFLFCLFRILPMIGQLASNFTQFKSGLPSVNSLFDVVITHSKTDDASVQEIDSFNNRLELKSVSFRYPDSDTFVFKEVSMRVNKFEKVAIVGSSGSGKSTLLDLLLGVVVPESGEVVIDGRPTNPKSIKWAPRVGYVSQGFANFDLSVEQAVRFDFGADSMDINQLEQILSDVDLPLAELDEDKMSSKGTKFVTRLSGGQIQRIALARALFFEGDLIVLDEATSNLDEFTSRKVLNKFLALNKTLILVTHSTDDLVGFDKVYRVENGKLLSIQ